MVSADHVAFYLATVGDGAICEVGRDRDAEDRQPWTGPLDWCGEWTAASEDDDWETVVNPNPVTPEGGREGA